MPPTLDLHTARRIALGALGFAQERRGRATGARQYARVMARLGLIQLDSVNVCVRSHYMPFYSRLGAYDRLKLDTWLNTHDRHFEYWAHEASVMPVELYPLFRWKMQEWTPWNTARLVMNEHPGLSASVLRQVRERGPLTVRELHLPKARSKAWWGHGPGKLVLETLFGAGKLTALRGDGFARRYELMKRAIPEGIQQKNNYDKRSAHKELLRRATRHYGLGTVQDLADYYRLKPTVARPLLAELAAEGELDEVSIEGWKGPVYRDPAAHCPRRIVGGALLSPFDPVTWYRKRAERLFNFRYRIEIYTPQDRRQYGYYVLPFLLDGELVARVDLKADRQCGVLRVPSAFVEANQDKARIGRALAKELRRFAEWLALGGIAPGRKGNLMQELRRHLT